MQSLTATQETVRRKVLEYRRLERIVTSKSFEVAFEKVPSDNVIKMVETCACDDLKKWISQTLAESYGEYSIKQLRQLAIRLGIKNYSFMAKPELLSAIVGKENEQS